MAFERKLVQLVEGGIIQCIIIVCFGRQMIISAQMISSYSMIRLQRRLLYTNIKIVCIGLDYCTPISRSVYTNGSLYFAKWGSATPHDNGIVTLNLLSNQSRLFIANPFMEPSDSCVTNGLAMYGLSHDATRIFFSAGNVVYYRMKTGGDNNFVCDCSEKLSYSPAGFAPGRVYGLAVSASRADVYVVGSTGDQIGYIITCNIASHKITYVSHPWNLAQESDKYIVAVGSDTSTPLLLGNPCNASCGKALRRPFVEPYPAKMAKVFTSTSNKQTVKGEAGYCFGTRRGAFQFKPDETQRTFPRGIWLMDFGPVAAWGSARIFGLRKVEGGIEVLELVDSNDNSPTFISGATVVNRLLVSPGVDVVTGLDQDFMTVTPDESLIYFNADDYSILAMNISTGVVQDTGYTFMGPHCSASVSNCEIHEVCQNIPGHGTRCRTGVAFNGQSEIYKGHLYLARSLGNSFAGKPYGGIYRIPIITIESPIQVNQDFLFLENDVAPRKEMYGMVVDHEEKEVYFSWGAQVYRSSVVASAGKALSEINATLICDTLPYLLPLTGGGSGYIVGLGLNKAADEIYATGTNTNKGLRLVTCSISKKMVTFANMFTEAPSLYNSLKYVAVKPGASPNIGVHISSDMDVRSTADPTAISCENRASCAKCADNSVPSGTSNNRCVWNVGSSSGGTCNTRCSSSWCYYSQNQCPASTSTVSAVSLSTTPAQSTVAMVSCTSRASCAKCADNSVPSGTSNNRCVWNVGSSSGGTCNTRCSSSWCYYSQNQCPASTSTVSAVSVSDSQLSHQPSVFQTVSLVFLLCFTFMFA